MKRITILFSILFTTSILHAQIETVTVEDLGDTTLLNDSLHLARLAGLTADGSLIALPNFCVDSSGCIWIKDTFGINRAKIVVDSSEITVHIIKNNKVTIIKKININNNNFILCGIRQFQWKFGRFILRRVIVDTIGYIHVIRDTSMGGSEFRIRYDPKNCIIETSKTGGVTVTQRLDSTGASTTVRDTSGNEMTERIDPALCKKTLSTNKSAVNVMEVIDSNGFSRMVMDTSGKSITEDVDLENCKVTESNSATDVTVMRKIDDSGATTMVMDTSGNSMTDQLDPENCKRTLSTGKSAVSVMDIIDSTGSRRMVMDTSGSSITDEVDLANCKKTTSSSKTDVTIMQRLDSTGASSTVMDTSGNSISERTSPDSCEIERRVEKSSGTVTTERTRITSSGTSTTTTAGDGPSAPSVTETTDASGQSVLVTGSSQCVDYKIEGNLQVTKSIFADSINANFGNFITLEALEIFTGILDAFSIFADNLVVTGDKMFCIPHPLDPKHKYLAHASIEGPERMNIYNGNVVTDEEGFATIAMPDYFMALNTDFKYNLTVVGKSFAQAIVWEEMNEQGEFVIRTNQPNIKVSWQVTGTRQDEHAREIPFQVELTTEEFEQKYKTR